MKIQTISLFNNARANVRLQNIKNQSFQSKFRDELDIDTVRFNRRNEGKTHLMMSIEQDNDKLALLLLKYDDIFVNNQDVRGRTALMYAVQKEKPEIVSALLNREDIDVSLKDRYNKTALDYAQELKNTEILKLLER